MGEKWSQTQEEEDAYRRSLLKKAGKGDPKATQELSQTYAVRVWSESERQQLVYLNPKYKEPKAGGNAVRKVVRAVRSGKQRKRR